MSVKLESGQEYNLSNIFSENRKIVIPDLQRDYCWGDKAWNKEHDQYIELVSSFLDNLLDSFQHNPDDRLLLGLVYGYEQPLNYIQLCDGQQRITTLYLILGIINRYANNKFRKFLISDEELNDDNEPYLLYAIRESTLYFTSDLVSEIFLKSDYSIKDIKNCKWYFKEYDEDPSIQSIISALQIIESKIVNIDEIVEFGEFILGKIQVLYYDMGDRTNGEETFVVINTTGEPLSASENLKPILIGNIKDEIRRDKASNEWEIREEWFWKNKEENERTSDAGHLQFFIWYWQIRLLQEKAWKDKKSYNLNPIELFQKKPKLGLEDEEQPDLSNWKTSVDPDTFHSYFNALDKVLLYCQENKIANVLKTIQNGVINLEWFKKAPVNVVLPLISYLEKFPVSDECFYQFVRRLRKNFYNQEWIDRKDKYVDWRHIIQIIGLSENSEDLLNFKTLKHQDKFKSISGVKLNEWHTEEEMSKDLLKVNNKDIIENWEDHFDFMGDLSFILNAKENHDFISISNYYKSYTEIIDTIRNQVQSKESNIYRLFLVVADIQKIEHKSRMSWGIEGVLFSTIDSSRSHLSNKILKDICKNESSTLINHCIIYIQEQINLLNLFNLTEENFTTERALKCWVTLKAFEAFKNDQCLNYHDGNDTGVSVYKDYYKNKLLKEEAPLINNLICGFGVKAGGNGSYVRYAESFNWLKNTIIDTPFAGIAIDSDKRDKNQLHQNQVKIDEIIDYIINLKY